MVDEAHSIGVLGRCGGGVCEELGVDPTKIDILMGTLSKSFASCGGYLAGSRSFIQNLRYSLSGYIFSTGMTPANTAAALEAIRVMRDEPERLIRLRQNAEYFLARATEMKFNCGTATAGVPVVPTIFGDSATTITVANFMFENGVSVNPIIFPAVAESLARLRFFITSEHTPEIIDETLSILQRAVQSTKNLAA
jgi:7-keto-8-aminopelargonate synthetase-like enzyme